MKILISPAKSINENVEVPNLNFSTLQFQKEAKKLVSKLKKLKAKDIMSLMHVSKDIAELNVNRFKNWHITEEPTEKVKPAGFLFTGEVYRGLDFTSLSEENMLKAQDKLRILSGMYGLLKPLDLMYPYRLEMGTSFKISEDIKNLYQFWDNKLTKQLLKETDKNEVIVNLASAEYAKAIQWKNLKRSYVQPNFKEFKNGEYKMVMVFAKQERGAMARYLIENELTDIQELKTYNLNGYSFDEKQSTETDWIFVR
jgi:uncharacterized protein